MVVQRKRRFSGGFQILKVIIHSTILFMLIGCSTNYNNNKFLKDKHNALSFENKRKQLSKMGYKEINDFLFNKIKNNFEDNVDKKYKFILYKWKNEDSLHVYYAHLGTFKDSAWYVREKDYLISENVRVSEGGFTLSRHTTLIDSKKITNYSYVHHKDSLNNYGTPKKLIIAQYQNDKGIHINIDLKKKPLFRKIDNLDTNWNDNKDMSIIKTSVKPSKDDNDISIFWHFYFWYHIYPYSW